MSYQPNEDEVWYIASKMSGLPRFGYDRFDAVATDLRGQGFTIVSPAELDTEKGRAAAWESAQGDHHEFAEDSGITWGDCLARDVKIIADRATGVIVFDEWYDSRGARLETFAAKLCDKPVLEYATLEPVDEFELVTAWTTVADIDQAFKSAFKGLI